MGETSARQAELSARAETLHVIGLWMEIIVSARAEHDDYMRNFQPG